MNNPQSSERIRGLSRRGFIAGAAGLAAAGKAQGARGAEPASSKPPICLFSKHLGWTDYDELADRMAELGFDGADLTVRPGGHVLPENAERDLPRAVEAIRKVGLDVHMITSGISDPDDERTEPILKTASALGIRIYRIGTYRYESGRDIMEQLREWNAKLKQLAAMNEHYNIAAAYHNHSGVNDIGGPIWDILEMLKGIDPKWVGSNFDAGHAVAEGSAGAWITNFKVISDRIHSSAVKDFAWDRTERGFRKWFPPVGQGMVEWPRVLFMFRGIDFQGPFSMHFEYDIEAANEEEERKNTIAAIDRDLKVFRRYVDEVWA